MWVKVKNQVIHLDRVESILLADDQITFQFSAGGDLEQSSITFQRGTILTDQEFVHLSQQLQKVLQYTVIL
ncbi:MAG TPA: hypothetical protein PK014_07945 [Thermoanaerobaculia bacterium]|nr:hypothetical protein [Thermoanaerobaculia bacterium]HUM30039.1 hypothetical protein [Thermoanaerobaculia bacterium]HXK68272.1 hypothetical protein [Thermoanaerobaculia bacterium]